MKVAIGEFCIYFFFWHFFIVGDQQTGNLQREPRRIHNPWITKYNNPKILFREPAGKGSESRISATMADLLPALEFIYD